MAVLVDEDKEGSEAILQKERNEERISSYIIPVMSYLRPESIKVDQSEHCYFGDQSRIKLYNLYWSGCT